jgi:hypothetical protein
VRYRGALTRFPRDYHAAARIMPEPQLKETLANLGSSVAAGVRTMPAHEAWLKRF